LWRQIGRRSRRNSPRPSKIEFPNPEKYRSQQSEGWPFPYSDKMLPANCWSRKIRGRHRVRFCWVKAILEDFDDVCLQSPRVQSELNLDPGFRSEFTRGLSLPTARILLDPSEDGTLFVLFPTSRDSLSPLAVDIGRRRVAVASVVTAVAEKKVVR